MGFNGTGLSGMSLSNMGLYVSVFKVDVGCFFSARTFSSRFRGFARPCFLLLLLSHISLHWAGRFHWRRFIGGLNFVSLIFCSTLFEKHFKLKTISCGNQLKKRKENVLNRAIK